MLIYHVLVVAMLPLVVMGATRCYDGLGCFESGILHALPQDPDHVRTQFIISCRNHSNDVKVPGTADANTKKALTESSCFQVDRPTKFLIHGFTDNGFAGWVNEIRDLLLAKDDYNVVVVDWQHGANFPYEQAVANTFLVAKQTALYIRELETVLGLSPLEVHLIGHSLGAQTAGNTGYNVGPSRIGRISGLDPAAPYFDEFNDNQRLDKSDAIFVDVIHTDGENFVGTKGYGSSRVQGHVDFYPNGGERQPGCEASSQLGTLLPGQDLNQQIACSHIRAYELFAQSLRPTSCQLTAHACNSWDEFETGNCSDCTQTGCGIMGIDAEAKTVGVLYLSTSDGQPYCGDDFKLRVFPDESTQHFYGRLAFKISDGRKESNWLYFNRKEAHFRGSTPVQHVMTSPATLNMNSTTTMIQVRSEKGSGLSAITSEDRLVLKALVLTDLASGKCFGFLPSYPNADTLMKVNKSCNDAPFS